MNCPVCGRLEYDCECEPSEPIPEIEGEDDTEDALRDHQEEQRMINTQGWIRSTEKLPLSYSPKLLMFINGGMAVGYLEPYRFFFSLQWRWNWGGRKTGLENVTHWRPLPEPPKEPEEQRKAAQSKKDAGDERLLCAVLFEEGEPN
jgi:hypothetical protein